MVGQLSQIHVNVNFTSVNQTTISSSESTSLSFFGKSEHTFKNVLFNQTSNPQIHFLEFIKACENYLKVYDLIGGAIFTPIKKDVSGHLTTLYESQEEYKKRLETKEPSNTNLNSNGSNHNNLLDILKSELEVYKHAEHINTPAVNALRWLKRGIWMFYHFSEIIVNTEGDVDPKVAFNQGYDKSLKKHNSWLVTRGIKIGLAVASPSFDEFAEKVCLYEGPKEILDTGWFYKNVIFKRAESDAPVPALEQISAKDLLP